jgi:hypothetical protein
MVGKRFGLLTVVARYGIEPTDSPMIYRTLWELRCKCGKSVIRATAALTVGTMVSCGRCNEVEDTIMTTDYQKDKLKNLRSRMQSELGELHSKTLRKVLHVTADQYLLEALDILGQEEIIEIYTQHKHRFHY